MPDRNSITSTEPALAAAVTAWLVESRMTLPPAFRIRLIVVDSVGVWDDGREIFPQGDVDIRAGEPLGWAHLTWRTAAARARIDEVKAEATIEVSREALAQLDHFLRSFLLVTLIFLWKRAGHYHDGARWDRRGSRRQGLDADWRFLLWKVDHYCVARCPRLAGEH